MIANFLEYFYTDKFDEKIILKKNSKNYSVKMVKDLVFERIQNNLTLNSTSKDFKFLYSSKISAMFHL